MMSAFVDMPSKLQWMSQEKKIAQPEEFPAASAEEENSKEPEGLSQFDIWSAIQSHKETDSNLSAPTPYIHPLVKRSASLLSDKSLEICTESLGSETGSDGFSPLDLDACSESEDDDAEEEEEELEHVKKMAVQYNFSISRKSPPRSFPPPLPSLSRREGPCLHMRPSREDGRLVLQAVPVKSHNYFHAQRQGSRLLLTFISTPPTREDQSEDNIDDVDNEEEEEPPLAIQEAEEEEESGENEAIDKKFVLEMEVSRDDIPSGLMKVNQSAIMVKKMSRSRGHRPLRNFNPWDEKKTTEEGEEYKVVARVLAVEPFNVYECWRRDNYTEPKRFSSSNEKEKGAALFVRNYCKDREPRRTPFILETRCMATS